jgi:hypothetical protein
MGNAIWGNRGCGTPMILNDEELIDAVYEACDDAGRIAQHEDVMERPAEVALRLLVLKHMREPELRHS